MKERTSTKWSKKNKTKNCKTYYTIDSTSTVTNACQPKEYCGMFMYQGLQPYTTLSECMDSWNQDHPDEPLQEIYVYDETSKKCIKTTVPSLSDTDELSPPFFASKRSCLAHRRQLTSMFSTSYSCGCGGAS